MRIVFGKILPHKLRCGRQTLARLKVTGHKTTQHILYVGRILNLLVA